MGEPACHQQYFQDKQGAYPHHAKLESGADDIGNPHCQALYQGKQYDYA